MAIDRLWQSGAETRSAQEISNINNVVLASGSARGGVYGFQFQFGLTDHMWQSVSDFVVTRQIRGGFGLVRNADVPTNDYEIFAVEDSADNPLIELMVDHNNDEIMLKIDGVQEDITVGNAWANDLGVWKYVTYDVYIHNAAGWVEIYLDGASLLSFAGDTGNVDIDKVMFGTYQDAGAGNQYTTYDDLYLENTAGEGVATNPPILIFELLRPNATGNYTQWLGSDGDNVNNYLHLDELVPNATDYVEEDTVDQFDSYAMTTHAIGAGETVVAVIPVVFAQRYGAAEEIALGTRYSGADLIGSDQDPGSGRFNIIEERQLTKPGGGDWNQASLDGLEVVLKSRGSF